MWPKAQSTLGWQFCVVRDQQNQEIRSLNGNKLNVKRGLAPFNTMPVIQCLALIAALVLWKYINASVAPGSISLIKPYRRNNTYNSSSVNGSPSNLTESLGLGNRRKSSIHGVPLRSTPLAHFARSGGRVL